MILFNTESLARLIAIAFIAISVGCCVYVLGMCRGIQFMRAARSSRIRRLEDERLQLCDELKDARRELMRLSIKENRMEEYYGEDVMERAFDVLEISGLEFADTRTAHDVAAIFIDKNGEPHEFWHAASPGMVNVVVAVSVEDLPFVTNGIMDILCSEKIADIGEGAVPTYHSTTSLEEAEEIVACCDEHGCRL